MLEIFYILISAGLGFLLGNYRSDREYFLKQAREATATLYSKSLKFSSYMNEIKEKGGIPDKMETEFYDMFNYFHVNALFFDDKLYEQIEKGIRNCQKFIIYFNSYSDAKTKEYLGKEPELKVNYPAFCEWYLKVYLVWLCKELKKVHNVGWRRVLRSLGVLKVEACPIDSSWEKSEAQQ